MDMTELLELHATDPLEAAYDRAMRAAIMPELEVVLREQFRRLYSVASQYDCRDPIPSAEETAARWLRSVTFDALAEVTSLRREADPARCTRPLR